MKIIIAIAGLIGIGLLFYSKSKKLDSSKFSVIELLSKQDLQSAISKNPSIQLVDVRKQAEWDKGHIAPAIRIDYFGKDFV